jgi:hypothetical protein
LVEDEFDSESLDILLEQCCELAFSAGIDAISLLVSLFLLDGCGAEILFTVATRLSFEWTRLEAPATIDFGEFVGAVARLQALLDSCPDGNLLKLGAVVALTEKIVVAAIRLKRAKVDQLKQVAKCLKVSFGSTDLGVMTTLKGQLHVSRMPIEMLMRFLLPGRTSRVTLAVGLGNSRDHSEPLWN